MSHPPCRHDWEEAVKETKNYSKKKKLIIVLCFTTLCELLIRYTLYVNVRQTSLWPWLSTAVLVFFTIFITILKRRSKKKNKKKSDSNIKI